VNERLLNNWFAFVQIRFNMWYFISN